MPVSISGTNGVTFPDSSLQAAAASPNVLKNRIINGAMVVDQRNAGASVTPANGQYLVDRWLYISSQASKFTAQQNAGSVTPPDKFTNYLGFTVASAVSIGASDYFAVYQNIEGFNVADLGWGTANAQTVTLSFWVRSSLTGTFGGGIFNGASNRAYPFTYTISVANTWEYKTITIPGDTTGTWTTNNTIGVGVRFGLGAGSTFSATAGSWGTGNIVSATGATSVVGTSGATFYITGVQLEQNTTATPFERRLYNQELANCQRYYYKFSLRNVGLTINANDVYNGAIQFPNTMRSAPTLDSGATFTPNTGSAGTVSLRNVTGVPTTQDTVTVFNSAGNWTATVFIAVSAGLSSEL
jgi:hypothetical protein